MPKTYTSNQTATLVLGFASSIWGITAIGVAIMTGNLPASVLNVFAILVIASFINFIFLLKLVRPCFLVAIAIWIISMIGILTSPATVRWYDFTNPVYNLTYLIFYLMALAGIYFAYKSYQELKK